MEDDKVCQVCTDFEPQAWRKSLCRNCFHTLDDHAEDLLAAEAEAVAKEKASGAKDKTSPKPVGKPDITKDKGSVVTEEKDNAKLTKPKFAPNKDKSGAWSWGKDLGVSYGKPTQKTTLNDKAKPTEPTSEASSTSSSSSLSSKQSQKPSNSPTSSTSDAQSKSAVPSKAKGVAAKFESKQATTKNDKPVSKPSDLRTSSASVSALSGKLSKDTTSSDSKNTTKSVKPDDSKSTDCSKVESSTEDKSKSTISKSVLSKSNVNGVDKSKDGKDKKDFKDTLQTRGTKAPFGKDMLKSTKKDTKPPSNVLKKDNEKSISTDKPQSTSTVKSKDLPTLKSTAKDQGPKTALGKTGLATVTGSQNLQDEKKSQSSSTSSPLSSAASKEEKTDGTKVNTQGQLAKYLPGRFGEGKSDSLRTAVPGHDVSTSKGTTEKPSTGNETVLSSNASKKSADQDKSSRPTNRDNQQSESVRKEDVTSGKGNERGEKTASAGRNDAVVFTAESNTTSTSSVVGQQSPSFKTSKLSSATSTTFTSSSSKSDSEKPRDTLLSSDKTPGTLNKFKDLDKKTTKKDEGPLSSVKSPSSSSSSKNNEKETPKITVAADSSAAADLAKSSELSEKLRHELEEKEEKLQALFKQVSKMEEVMKSMEEEKIKLTKEADQTKQSQREDVEKLLAELRDQLQRMETQCERLQKDNESLLVKVHAQEANVKKDQEERGRNQSNVELEEDLEVAERELEEVKEENKVLQTQIMDLKNEMDEMHDHFRENEHDEFRELQKELDMTAKNCRILQFKLRKSERRNEQIEEDRIHYEEKLRSLQDQFDSQDAKNHIHLLEEELRVAKEVSVRLHDELDIVEDKRNKALEENRHLTELLEHTDKRQFRLEMEIDKLRDVVQELRMQLREAKGGHDPDDSARKVSSYIYTRSIVD